MKKISYLLLTLAMVVTAGMSLTSCSVEDNPAVPQDPAEPQDPALADVTIMYYGHGGGNLDLYYIDNLRHLYQAEASSYENVKIAVEYKFSTTDNLPLFDSEEEIHDPEVIKGIVFVLGVLVALVAIMLLVSYLHQQAQLTEGPLLFSVLGRGGTFPEIRCTTCTYVNTR